MDVLGVCCTRPLSPSGVCCRGSLDSCGVCGGTNDCEAKVTLSLPVSAASSIVTSAQELVDQRVVNFTVTPTAHNGTTVSAAVVSVCACTTMYCFVL